MIQVLPQSPNVGANIGSALGQSITALADSHLGHIVKKQQRKEAQLGLEALGYSKENAAKLSQFDPQILKEVIKNERKKPSMAYHQALQKITTGKNPPKKQEPLEQFSQQAQQGEPDQSVEMGILNNLKEATGQAPTAGSKEALTQQLSQRPAQELLQRVTQKNQIAQQSGLNQTTAPQQQAQMQQQQPEEDFKIDYSSMSPSEAKEVYMLQREKLKEDEEKARNRFKDTKEFRKEILNKGAQARENLESLDRLEELNKKGNLNSNEYMEFLKGVGLDIPAMMTADTQEFNKITSNFIRGAKAIFGSRVTEKELQYYLQTIPQMSNTPEGRNRVILNLKKLHRGEREILNTYKEILKENDNIPPYNIAEQVQDRSEKKLDAIYKQFKKELDEPFPNRPASFGSSGSRGIDVASGALLGKAIGRLPHAALGAAGGALAGSKIGLIGAVPGAIIGGLAGLSGVGIPKIF